MQRRPHVKCPECGKKAPRDAQFCPYCKKSFYQYDLPVKFGFPKSTQPCRFCSRPIPFDAKLCPYCARELTTAPKAKPKKADIIEFIAFSDVWFWPVVYIVIFITIALMIIAICTVL